MTDWTSALHSMAGAILGAGAALTGQLIMAANTRNATRNEAHNDHRKWARDLAAQAHDGYIVEFERLSPFYGVAEGPLAPDWMTGLHLRLQRMRLVCSHDSVALAHTAMHALERYKEQDRYRESSDRAWLPVQAAFDTYLGAARRDLGLAPHNHPEPLHDRVLDHAHLGHLRHHEPAQPPSGLISMNVAGEPNPIAVTPMPDFSDIPPIPAANAPGVAEPSPNGAIGSSGPMGTAGPAASPDPSATAAPLATSAASVPGGGSASKAGATNPASAAS